MNDGYIKLFRKFTKWEWYSDINTKTLFLHLLLTANHEDKKWRGIVVEKGQVIVGRTKLSKDLHLSERQIRTSLEHLKSTNEITTKTTNKFTIVTLVNWEKYQDYDTRTTNSKSNKLPTSDQQPTTNNNEKNEKNKRNNIYAQMFEDFWSIYPKKRNKSKCKEWYLKNKPSEELQKEILLSVAFFKNEKQWKDEQFIPYPTTFLNQKRWEDISDK